MLSLTIADRGEPLLPDPRDPLVQTWRDYQGEVCAYAYISGIDHWLHVPNVASYRFDRKESEITAYPQPAVKLEKVRDIFSRVVLPIALHARGLEVLHASALLTPAGVVAFCAMADTGKSTTAFAMSQRGYQQWADDAVPFEIEDGKVIALPLSFGIRLDPDAEEHLNASEAISERVQLSEERTNVVALFVLKRSLEQDGGDVSIKQLSPAQAFRAVLLHGHFFNLKTSELMRQMISNYLKLTSLVPVFEVRFRPGFDRLPLLLDQLEVMFEKLRTENERESNNGEN
jgi:hypothetical protein